jgi:hypothetical protein
MKINKMKQAMASLNMSLMSSNMTRFQLFSYKNSFQKNEKVIIETTESLQLKLKNAKKDRINKAEIKKIKAKIKEIESKKLYLSTSNKYL